MAMTALKGIVKSVLKRIVELKLRICSCLFWLLWIALIFVFFFNVRPREASDSVTPVTRPQSWAASQKLNDLKIFDQDQGLYAEWDRAEVVKFGLDHVSSSINYLFIAAAAILGLIGKIAIDPLIERPNTKYLRPSIVMLLRHASVGCGLSILFGFFANLYFNNIADRVTFTIHGALGIGAAFQLVAFIFGAALLVLAVGLLLRDHEK